MRLLTHSWFARDAVMLAPKLLGKIVRKASPSGECAGIIVETEAYTIDPASHAFRLTPRSQIMRDTFGHWYVYFTYGMHWCANITTNSGSIGAILIRAVEPSAKSDLVLGKPIDGIKLMKKRRGTEDIYNLCSGPAKFCQAFGITGKENGLPIAGALAIWDAPEVTEDRIATSPRIGVKNGADLPWRFYIKDNPFVSR